MTIGRNLLMMAALAVGTSGAWALDLKEITYNTKGAGKVVFSHKSHLKKRSEKSPNVSCKACHEGRDRARTRYTMADMEKGKSCGRCHTGKTAFALQRCTGCHKVKEITFNIKETGPVRFSHAQHLKKMQCDSCHNNLYATGPNPRVSMAEMERGKSCGACHDGKKAVTLAKCSACHPAPKQVVFKVKETGPTPFSHQKHTARYKCGSCHTRLYPIGGRARVTMAAMEKGASCGACHDAREAFALAKCQKCHPVKEIHFRVAKAADVDFSHAAHLGNFKCSACHTRTFPLSGGTRAVAMSEMRKGKSCGACHDGKMAFTVSGNCDSCHVRGQRG